MGRAGLYLKLKNKQKPLRDLLNKPITATDKPYDVFGDDNLFDELKEIEDSDAGKDARDIIKKHLIEMLSGASTRAREFFRRV